MRPALQLLCICFTSAYITPSPFTSPRLSTALSVHNPSSNQHIRILKRGKHYDVQTAVTSFKRRNTDDKLVIDLHSQIHCADEAYFNYYSQMNYDAILYELLVEQDMLIKSDLLHSLRKLKPIDGMNPIQPTQTDRNTASQYGLTCQVDGINYCNEGWVHADLTREEFLEALNQGQQQKLKQDDRPLWALASTSPTNTLQEGISSLVNPPTSASNSLSRRLFSHLFLPGSSFAILLRTLLWIVPSPELSILLVDWSTINSKTSEIAIPVLLSLLSGRWGTARRLVFGQVLVGGANNGEDESKNGVLIEKRNKKAMDVLNKVQQEQDGKGKVALLYGASHCRDLSKRLIQDGYVPIKKEWRTAFTATPPNLGDFYLDVQDWKRVQRQQAISGDVSSWTLQSVDASTLESVAVSLVVLPLYLMLGGFDWVATISELGSAIDSGSYVDGFAAIMVDMVRHVALYVAISKFVVDWGGKGGVFMDEEAS